MNKEIIFYEKPGCQGNKRQKALFESYGLKLNVRSILETKWSKEELKSFFKGLTMDEIFNKFAPQIKNNQIDLAKIKDQNEAIELMVLEPILIKRPLLEIDGIKICGFDTKQISRISGIEIDDSKDISTCQKNDKCKQDSVIQWSKF